MKTKSKLTLAFLQHDPASAAGVLQQMDPGVVAAFLDTVPARLASPVLNAMIPFAAAHCLSKIAPHRAAAALRHLTPHERTGLARLLPTEVRDPILDELPDSAKRHIVNALRYPVNSVGAWIDPRVPVLRTDSRVSDALKFLQGSPNVSHVFLEDSAQGLYLGAVAIVTLIGCQAGARLNDVARVAVEPLSNRATLATAQSHPDWDRFLMLPVTGRRGTVLGALSREAIRAGLQETHASAAQRHRPMIAELSSALLACSAGLARLVLPSSQPIDSGHPQGDSRA
jgi:Mg/Co/Ni transporter MgtE